jgi:hypothetical protein
MPRQQINLKRVPILTGSESIAPLVERLESDQLSLRLGAIMLLERIARESGEEYWPIIELLTEFVVARTEYTGSEGAIVSLDVQSAMNVIGRRMLERETYPEQRLHLSGVDLRGVFLPGAHLERAYLTGAHLERAAMTGCHLVRAYCEGTHFAGAWLSRADLYGAVLREADLRGAWLGGANLKGADIEGARLEGVDLREVAGLTCARMVTARTDAQTLLPDYLMYDSAEAGVDDADAL